MDEGISRVMAYKKYLLWSAAEIQISGTSLCTLAEFVDQIVFDMSLYFTESGSSVPCVARSRAIRSAISLSLAKVNYHAKQIQAEQQTVQGILRKE